MTGYPEGHDWDDTLQWDTKEPKQLGGPLASDELKTDMTDKEKTSKVLVAHN